MAIALQHSMTEHYMSVAEEFTGIDGREFGRSVLHALEDGKRHVVVDCTGWRRLDFVLLSSLVKCADVFSSRGASLELVNLSPEMHANIRELRLQNRLGVAD
jgi:anti-anti-sigma regulatory factor